MLEFAKSRGESTASLIPKRFYQIFKCLNGEALKKWVGDDKSKIYHGTVAPNDVFLLPAGWIFLERALAAQDITGFRMACVLKLEREIYEKINQWLLTCKKTSDCLQKAVDALIVAAA